MSINRLLEFCDVLACRCLKCSMGLRRRGSLRRTRYGRFAPETASGSLRRGQGSNRERRVLCSSLSRRPQVDSASSAEPPVHTISSKTWEGADVITSSASPLARLGPEFARPPPRPAIRQPLAASGVKVRPLVPRDPDRSMELSDGRPCPWPTRRIISFVHQLLNERHDAATVTSVLLETAIETYEQVHGIEEAAQAVARVWAQAGDDPTSPSSAVH